MPGRIKQDRMRKEQERQIVRLKNALAQADTVVIGAGSGLSTAAGFTYSGERFRKYFSDFEETYGFHDMYAGGFYPYNTLEEHWGFWSRYIYVNRYMDPPEPLYEKILDLVKEKDYFVLTTNVDHCFQKAGVDKTRLFYTQGDYGLFQCSEPCQKTTYENGAAVRDMLKAQGFTFGPDGDLCVPEPGCLKRVIPSDLIPRCPCCGKSMSMNLRADDTFVEDAGWHRAAERYTRFLQAHQDRRVLYLELGVGYNTPGIIKYPFWQLTYQNHRAVYACLNFGEAAVPEEIALRSICINADIADIIEELLK